jgi:hypothetical protein
MRVWAGCRSVVCCYFNHGSLDVLLFGKRSYVVYLIARPSLDMNGVST